MFPRFQFTEIHNVSEYAEECESEMIYRESVQDRGKVVFALDLERQVAAVFIPCLLGSLTHYRADVLQGQLYNALQLELTVKGTSLDQWVASASLNTQSDALMQTQFAVLLFKNSFPARLIASRVPHACQTSRYDVP